MARQLKITVKQGRGGRWRWYFVDDEDAKVVAMCSGSFRTNHEAMRSAQETANGSFDFGTQRDR